MPSERWPHGTRGDGRRGREIGRLRLALSSSHHRHVVYSRQRASSLKLYQAPRQGQERQQRPRAPQHAALPRIICKQQPYVGASMMSGQHLARPESQACPPQIKHQMRTAPATTLQRSHATAGQQHPGHHRPAPAMTAPSEHVAFGAAADHRGRASAEPGAQRPGMSPGKENRPLPSSRGASPTREPAPATSKSPLLGISLGRSKGKPSNKNESTQKQQNGSGPRSRSVSPSKRFKGKLKGGHDDSGNAAAQVNTSAAYPRSAREVDNEFIGMLVSIGYIPLLGGYALCGA